VLQVTGSLQIVYWKKANCYLHTLVHALYSLQPTLPLCIAWTVSQTSILMEYPLASSTNFYVSLE
jgi:hypothetical protein